MEIDKDIKLFTGPGSLVTHSTYDCEKLTGRHGRRKRGLCRRSDTPTIYVGHIDMYIPLEKPNT